MNEMEGDATQARPGTSKPNSSGGLHDVPGVQRFATELARVSAAVAGDEKLARQVIDAVHSGNGTDVERLFKEAGVDSRVSIETRKGAPPVDFEGKGEFAADSTHTHETVQVGIDLGPFHLGVDVEKDTTSG